MVAEAELKKLISEQERDDRRHRVEPEVLGGHRTASLQIFIDSGRDASGDDTESVRASGPKDASKVGGVTDPRPAMRPNRVRPITRPRTGYEREALGAALGPFLSDLPLDKLEAIRLVVYGQLSQRQAAAVIGGISQPGVLKRLRTGVELLRPWIEARTGSEGQDFPSTRPLDESDTCRIRPQDDYAHDCDGHFAGAVCDCGTVLPLHYNAHTTCRVHSAGKRTRYQHNIAWLIESGLRVLGGHTRRTSKSGPRPSSRSGGGRRRTTAGPAPGTANDDRRTA